MKKIILVGSKGYVGSHILKEIKSRENLDVACVNSRNNLLIADIIEASADGFNFLINAAGFTGKPNVDACESKKADCLEGNVFLPLTLQQLCEDIGIGFGHVSSGCIYSGSRSDGTGFKETDPPNFCFGSVEPCSFYSGTKALAEDTLKHKPCYIWRLRIPFNDDLENPRNYIYKILHYKKLLNARNSISHIDEFARACVECVERELPFGIYNIVNGEVWTKDVVNRMFRLKKSITGKVEYFEDLEEFNKTVIAPRSNCVLSNKKITDYGIKLTAIEELLYDY